MKGLKYLIFIGSFGIMTQVTSMLKASVVELTGTQAGAGGTQSGCVAQSASATVVPDKTPPGPTSCCSTWTYSYTDYSWTGATGSSDTASVDTSTPGNTSVGVTMKHHWVCSSSDATTITTEVAEPVTLILDDPTISGPNMVGINTTITLVTNSSVPAEDQTWTPSNSNASVDGGVVTGASAGTCTITMSDGGCIATYAITITTDPPPPITLAGPKQYIQLNAPTKDTATFTASSTGTFKSSASSIATIDPSSGVATPVKVGTTQITVTAGGNTSNAITLTVYTIDTNTAATAPSNSDNTRKTIGVGEKVTCTLSSKVTGLTWNNTGTGTVTATGVYYAGDIGDPKQKVTVTGPQGLSGEVDFNIIAPTGATYKYIAPLHINGTCSVGFGGFWYLQPTNVSFSQIEICEEDAQWYGSSPGEFADMVGKSHFGDEAAPAPTGIDSNNVSERADQASSNTYQGPTFTAGTVEVDIPLDYLTIISNTLHRIPNFTQQEIVSCDNNGTATVKKNLTTVTAAVGGASQTKKAKKPKTPPQ